MNAVKLRFRVMEKTESVSGHQLKLSAVYDQDDPNPSDNQKFWDATPSGELSFFTVNSAAAAALKVGANVYITLEPEQLAEQSAA